MTDRHLGRRTNFRPPDDVKAKAQEVLAEHDWTLNEFLVACLVMVSKNPKDMLRSLDRTRVSTKMGRPKKTTD